MSLSLATSIELKRREYLLDYSHVRGGKTAHPNLKKDTVKRPHLVERFVALPANVQKEIIRYAITKETCINTVNPITLMHGLVGERMHLIRPFSLVRRYWRMTEEVFWVQNTVAVISLEELDDMVSLDEKLDIKRSYITHEPYPEAKYSTRAVTSAAARLRHSLVRMPNLTFLAVALSYDNLTERIKKAEKDRAADEMKIVVEAVMRMKKVSEKVVLLKQTGQDAAIGAVSPADTKKPLDMVKKLLALGLGDGLLI